MYEIVAALQSAQQNVVHAVLFAKLHYESSLMSSSDVARVTRSRGRNVEIYS